MRAAANQKWSTGEMWMRFEGDRYAAAGWWDTSRKCGRKTKGRGIRLRQGQDDEWRSQDWTRPHVWTRGRSGESKSWGYRQCWTVQVRTSRHSFDGKSLASRRKILTAEKVEDNLSQRRAEKSEECGSLVMWEKSRKKTSDISAHQPGSATGSVQFWKIDVIGPVNG